ncbi:hypothetical protein CHH55_15890 [Niallia circulans]|jgi:hypothetical protein|uniref:Uncharacterized protein n=1 Tax=Niallia circulans TaxID=1397 RepID=A0A0J1IPT5_NIACI|nr:hypothetical protein [Niallia circulans]KLV27969.1 hypothetical protein ABW02_03495 [Niallia circulans]MCM2982971.1 hypothetical protein [Niallia circulans]MDR4314779.1 hypothetical protein [Niallia circulans]MED3837906.1 hypothetical protein [Niallia circulans]MED4242947.1 hypothetical protein [Niallia circulans]
MIQAIGVVDFHYKPTRTTKYRENVTKRINAKTNKYDDSFEVLTISEPYDMDGDIFVRVSCSFTIYMYEKAYIRNPEEYVGSVFPTLKERITPHIIATKVYSLTKRR